MSKEHDHDHDHDHSHGCCGHGHGHVQEHKHEHEHGHECCGHEHQHDHAPEHKQECCGHDHAHEHKKEPHHHHEHSHTCCGHDHDHAHAHAHEDAEWTRRFFAFLQGVVLLMIGGVMVYFVASGRVDAYLVGWFKVLALCGGLGLMVLGLFNWITSRYDTGGCGHDHDHDPAGEDGEDAPHVHSHDGSVAGRALTLLVLSGSIATASMFTPDGFSKTYMQHKGFANQGDRNSVAMLRQSSPAMANAGTASQPGGFTLAKMEEYVKRTKEGNFPLSVMNLHYLGADQEYARVLDGQQVETVGQVVKDEMTPGPNNLRVFVMQITCCAADARPYSVPVVFEGKVPDNFVEMGWYKVRGKLEFTEERGMKMALVRAKELVATIRPDQDRPGM